MKKFQKDFIIKESKTDKISHHGYQRFYPWFLAHFRNKNINLLEIGIDRTESLKLWKGYFGKLNHVDHVYYVAHKAIASL